MSPVDRGPSERRDPVLRLPLDGRAPTRERFAARAWNPDDHRLFTPKVYGWGYRLNVYWLVHPVTYARGGSRRR